MFNYCVIMAAGAGSRLLPLTVNTPKALLNVGGLPLISHTLEQLAGAINTVAVTVGKRADKLVQHIYCNGGNIILNTSERGNSWWLFNTVLSLIDEPILVLPCDNITHINLDFLFNSYTDLGKPPCLVVPVLPVENIVGDYIFGQNNIVSKLSRSEKSAIYCSGIQVLNPRSINRTVKEQDDFLDVWNSLIRLGGLKFSNIYPESWYSINDLVQLSIYSDLFNEK